MLSLLNRTAAILVLPVALACSVALLAGCQGRELNIFGYSTEPQFDPSIRSVYIPVFKNIAFHTNPHRGIEADVTEAVVRELGKRRSTIRVVSDPARADTELIGTIIAINKGVLNRNQQNYTREAELVITAEIVWRDLRDGRVLTSPAPPSEPDIMPFDPTIEPPPPPRPEELARPQLVTAAARILPELGESNASAQKLAVDQLARQIVNMMERDW